MEKHTIIANFQKAIEALKNTECSQKEKLSYFGQISDSILSPSIRNNTNYVLHVSGAITVLLMFCEDIDSTTRMNAEENLNKIIRYCETTYIVRIQYDLYHEIKKNGNERSLRICLNLFAHYCHLIKQKKIKPYALNLLPCIDAISKRNETLLIETLSEFLKSYCKYLQICLNENEVVKLIEVFLNDTIAACAVKRRCAAQNALCLIENSRRKDLIARHALIRCTEILIKDQDANTIIGILGFLRLLLPILLAADNCDFSKIIEIYDVCLYLLHDKSHSIINASLEVIYAILNEPIRCELKILLTSLEHTDIVRKRKSLKNTIFNRILNESKSNSRKSSAETIRNMNKLNENDVMEMETNVKSSDNTVFNKYKIDIDGTTSSSMSTTIRQNENENEAVNKENFLDVKQHHHHHHGSNDEKSLTYSDIEMDSFKSIDFESEVVMSHHHPQPSSSSSTSLKDKRSDTISLKSQKSTESIGSFINSLLSHSNTESVSKFFRTKNSESMPSTPKNSAHKTDQNFVRYPEGDNLSLCSINSHISESSHLSSTFSTMDITDKEEMKPTEDASVSTAATVEVQQQSEQVKTVENTTTESETVQEIFIGTIFDQNLIYFTTRLISSKFLLSGQKQCLIPDNLIRVSIKNVSLLVVSHCVKLCPEILLQKLHNYHSIAHGMDDLEDFNKANICDDSDLICVDVLPETEPTENLLVMKDDHFGESTCKFIDFLSPLSKSVDTILLAQPKPKEPNTNDQLSKTLNSFLSKSEIIEIKRCVESPAKIRETKNVINFDDQTMEDILLYYNNPDPILRGDVQIIVGKLIAAVVRSYGCFEAFFERFNGRESFLQEHLLVGILIKGLTDDTHIVVKQSLVSIDNALPFLIYQSRSNKNAIPADKRKLHKIASPMQADEAAAAAVIDMDNILLLSANDYYRQQNITIEHLIEALMLVYENKYWVVQCKYCDLISKLDFENIKLIYGRNLGEFYEQYFLDHIYMRIGDQDIRIQKSAAIALCQYIKQKINMTPIVNSKSILLSEFVCERVFKALPQPLCNFKMRSDELCNETESHETVLAKVLYTLTNKLLELNDKNQQLGTVNAIMELIKQFNPVHFHTIWTEFNILEICLTYINQNYTTGTDLTCQCDLIAICTNLLAGDIFNRTSNPTLNKQIDILLNHILKILNIFHHVFNGLRPMFLVKGQFLGSKEMATLSRRGYFGNDYFYIKIFNMIKVSYDNYKISINKEAGKNVMTLLKVCLHSLAVLLEIKQTEPISESIKLIQEILIYLTTLINFTPKKCVVCIKHLLKYMFSMNFDGRLQQYKYFIENSFDLNVGHNIAELFEMVKEFPIYKGSFASDKSPTTNSMGQHIKIFEPIVIRCLKLFTKSNAEVQSVVLDMLCQALELKVNYSLLDANNVFIDFVLEQLELIETGTVRKNEILIPSMIKFMFYLSKQKDKKIITIPKIINITDTLLANSATLNSSTCALNELAFTFFFEQVAGMSGSEDSNMELSTKDINTQKEVAFSMLIKFLDTVEIQKIMCAILLLNKANNAPENENELYVNILQLFEENKTILTDYQGYNSMDMMFKVLNENVLMQSENFFKLLTIFFNNIYTKKVEFKQLALISLLLANAIAKMEEPNLLNHIKEFVNNSAATEKFKTIEINEISFFCKAIYVCLEKCMLLGVAQPDNKPYSKMLDNFLNNLACLRKFPKIVECLNRDYFHINNHNLINIMFTLSQQRQNIKTILLFTDFLLTVECDKMLIFNQISGRLATSDTILHKTLATEIVRIMCRKQPQTHQWKSNEINFVVERYMEILFVAGRQFLMDMVAAETYSIKLLEKLKVFKVQPPNEETHQFFLDLLENTDITKSLPITIDILMDKFLCSATNNTNIKTTKRAAIILSGKLNALQRISSSTSDIKEIHKILPESQYKIIVDYCCCCFDEDDEAQHQLSPKTNKICQDIVREAVNGLSYLYNIERSNVNRKSLANFAEWKTLIIDDIWFYEQARLNAFASTTAIIDNEKIVMLLNEIKSESKLYQIFVSSKFDPSLIRDCIVYSFGQMERAFKNDCMQYNAHLNYLKIQPLLKIALITLNKNVETLLSLIDIDEYSNNTATADELFLDLNFCKKLTNLMDTITAFMECISLMENVCLIYIESKLVDKFFKEYLFKPDHYELFIKFATVCMMYANFQLTNNTKKINNIEAATYKCTNAILCHKFVWPELNQPEKYNINIELILNIVHVTMASLMANSNFIEKYNKNHNLFKSIELNNASIELYKKALFVAKVVEISHHIKINALNMGFYRIQPHLLSIAIALLRTDLLYIFAITPYEILANYPIDLSDPKLRRLPSIPIEYLNDVEVVENFVKRINIFGFSSRQHFEEFFMTLLVLINRRNDPHEMEITEQHQIKSICLSAITELLISCKMYPTVGCRNGSSRFVHSPRLSQIKADTISLKKLHKLLLLLPGPNLFYQSNLERKLQGKPNDNIISSNRFLSNQMEMNFIWQIVEEISDRKIDVFVKNARHYVEQSGIDLKSSFQTIFDVFSLLIEEDYVLVLPHITKLCEICETREQYKWIKDTMLRLQEKVQMENAVCHQHIIYCLCKSHAVLVPSLSDLTHLCTIIQNYLKSTHLFVRNATLKGLLCLLESCSKTNTTIGSLSEELSLIRNVVVDYITKYGVIDESPAAYSDEHTKLVWTINFYLIETTSKFVTDCNLLANTIISANNILKRTINLDQYLCILHGLERLVARNVAIKMFREKIEKIALDLVKSENERFSIPALKLLITCMYIGSAEQLENTEHSNGIVQDEPEVIVQSTEKIDVLFQRIKLSTPYAARIYGDLLCQITRDLVPPNEILTKVIKELLTLSQPYCEVIAKIVFQVFRSAIDSSYLPLLQDWLICSLPNFLSFPVNKAVWCLTVIFISASINLNLIKIFPEILAKYDILGDREILLFTLVSRDFYDKLNVEQKAKFKEVIGSSCDVAIFGNMLQFL